MLICFPKLSIITCKKKNLFILKTEGEIMRSINIIITIVLICSSLAFGRDPKFVQPKSNASIYKNETRAVNETSIAQVGVNERLKVLKTKRNHYQVKTADGTVGWIEKRLVASAHGKSFLFDDAEVIGYLDNPTPVYIIDADSKDATPIKLDRSFAEALRENVDREGIERQGK